MKEVLILEDSEEERKRLEIIVRQVDDRAEIYSVGNEIEAYSIALKGTIDLFLIDLRLYPGRKGGDQTGAVFANNIRNVKKYQFTPIICISALADLKFIMYNYVHCYKYIEKPYDSQSVQQVIQKAIQYQTDDSNDRSVFLRVNGILEAVNVNDIIFAINKGQKLYVITVKDMLIVPCKSCISFLKNLDSEYFMRCSRQAVVNINYIKSIDPVNRYIYLKNSDTVLEIGVVYKKRFMKNLKEFIPVIKVNDLIQKRKNIAE